MDIIEKELKYYLNEKGYKVLTEYFGKRDINLIKCIDQVNYYIDTKELLFFKNDTTVRIRKVLNPYEEYEITIKLPILDEEQNNLKIKKEVNLKLEKTIAEDLIENQNFNLYKEFLQDFFDEINFKVSLESLRIKGELSTEREFYLIDNMEDPLNIDISTYLGIKDYEIEWETENIAKSKEIIEDLLYSLDISIKDEVLSKNKRFYNEYLMKEV